MYSENFNSEDDRNSYRSRRPNGMASASLVFGILSLSSITFPLSAIIFGALAVLCALLSRTDGMPKRSIAGLILALVSVVGSGFMIYRTVLYLQKNPQLLSFYQSTIQSVFDEYGMSDVYDELFGSQNPSGTNQLPQENNEKKDSKEAPSSGDSENDSEDYGSFFDDLYRYYFDGGSVPAPSAPSSPSTPSFHVSGGDFV